MSDELQRGAGEEPAGFFDLHGCQRHTIGALERFFDLDELQRGAGEEPAGFFDMRRYWREMDGAFGRDFL